MKRTLAAVALLALAAPPAWGEPTDPAVERSDEAEANETMWLCEEDACRLMSPADAQAAAEAAADEGRIVEVVLVTAPAPSEWRNWEFRDDVYDDWDYRDPTDW